MKTRGAIKLDVFGKRVPVSREARRWAVFYLGNDGKRRPADDPVIPGDCGTSKVNLADLCHEWATPRHPDVRASS